MGNRAIATFALAVTVTAGCGRLHVGDNQKQRQVDEALRTALQATPAFVRRDPEGTRLWKQTIAFYDHRQNQVAWVDGTAPGARMDALIEAIKGAEQEGLDPNLYNVATLEQRQQEASKGFLSKTGFDPAEAGKLDVWLTYLYLKYASDLADGISDLAHADPAWKIPAEKFDPLAYLETALQQNRIAESLRELTPSHPDYIRLREALKTYREAAAKGGWPAVPATLKLKPGQRAADVTILAKRLAVSGDYKGAVPADGQPAEYSKDLQEAVKTFQRRHGLTDNGVITPETVAEMKVPIDRRIAQIRLNMERWRWLPRDLGPRHIIVNIPEMRLDVHEGDSVPLTMRVVVGKPDTQTPIFSDEMTHVIFSPYWNVPPDIASKETLPAVMKDAAFLSRNNMDVVDGSGAVIDPGTIDLNDATKYRFRQRPGSSNSLGLVKFMFPNQFNVYLHDTPADSLFERAARSLSHGCVRLSEPQALAEYVLKDQPEWTPEKISEAMHAGEEKHVKLRQPIPVYLGYWTARVTPDGVVQFRKDVYNVDQRLTVKLQDRLARLQQTSEAGVRAAVEPAKPQKKTAKAKGARD